LIVFGAGFLEDVTEVLVGDVTEVLVGDVTEVLARGS
jgi:hypothetical protein